MASINAAADAPHQLPIGIGVHTGEVVAGMFGHSPRDYFEIGEEAKEPVKVQF